jgi:O-antigen/teichoic acid export membrane protein
VSLVRKSSLSALTAIVVAGGRFLLLAILARRLSTVDFGQFVYAQWLVDISFMVIALGANAVAARYFAEYAADDLRREHLLAAWLPWAIGLPVIAGIAAVVGAHISGLKFDVAQAALVALWGASAGWWAMQTAWLMGRQRFGLMLRANIVLMAVNISGALALPFDEAPEVSLFALMSAANVVACSFGIARGKPFVLARWFEKRIPGTLPWINIRRYAMNMWLTGLLWGLVWSRGEIPIVRAYLGDNGVAQYTVALTLFFGAMQAVMIWVGGIAPHLTALWGSGKKTEAFLIARHLSDIQLFVASVGSTVLWCLGPQLLSWAFGSVYGETSALPLSILVLGLITLSASVQNHLLQIETDASFNRNSSIVALIVLYAVSAIIIGDLGTVGAALARVSAMYMLFATSLAASRRFFGTNVISYRNTLAAFSAVIIPVSVDMFEPMSVAVRFLVAALSITAVAALLRTNDGTNLARELARSFVSRFLR